MDDFDRIVFTIVEKPKRAQGPMCMFCKGYAQPKIFVSGAVFQPETKVAVWECSGYCHWTCCQKAADDKRRELGFIK